MAVGTMAMNPEEFWSLTPDEFNLLAIAHARREHGLWERTAWLAASILNGLVKKRVRPSDLMPTYGNFDADNPSPVDVLTKEDIEEMARENKRKFWTKFKDDILKD